MTKKRLIQLIAVLLIIAAAGSFFIHRTSEDPLVAERIEEMADNGATEIHLSDITDFEWDRAMVYGPYTSNEVIEKTLDIVFKGNNHGIDMRDDMLLLVFASGKYAVRTVKLSRLGEYSFADEVMLTPEDDLLLVRS